MAKIDDFKKELKELLLKYNAEIDLDYDDCSDTYGMSGVCMTVTLDRKVHKIVDTWGFDAHDL